MLKVVEVPELTDDEIDEILSEFREYLQERAISRETKEQIVEYLRTEHIRKREIERGGFER